MANSFLGSSFAVLQKVGKSLMLPVSVLPVAGILLGVGASITGIDTLPGWLIETGSIMKAAGGAIFTILPLIFAIGVALGFTGNDGVAALAATVGYFVLVAALGVIGLLFISKFQPPTPLQLKSPSGKELFVEQDTARQRFTCLDEKGRILSKLRIGEIADQQIRCPASDGSPIVIPFSVAGDSPEGFASYTATDGSQQPFPKAQSRAEIKKIFGFESIDTGVFGGILAGLLAAVLFNRFYRIRLPQYLGFFAGKRFVPIIVSFAAIGLAAILALIWPPVGAAIRDFGDWAAYGNPAAAVTTYGVVERLLLPFGLHHIWNVPFFFEVGNYTTADGKVVHGVIHRFFAGDYEAAILGGGFVFKMWALPGAALAIYHCAKPEHKKRVAGIMGSAALTSFLTGITEPLEFSFLFVAPMLYGVHALLVGAAYFLTYVLGARLGYSFSQGFIDYMLFFGHDIRPWLILILGPIFAVIYYIVFRTLILKFNLQTPGREEESAAEVVSGEVDDFSRELVLAFGGRGNIKAIDACITRLRIELNNLASASQERLKELGASGVVVVGNSMQAIFGPRSENLMTDMQEYLKTAGTEADLDSTAAAAVSTAETPLAAVGGSANVNRVEEVAETRIRLELADTAAVREDDLRAEGVQIMTVGNGVVHLITGFDVREQAAAFAKLIAG